MTSDILDLYRHLVQISLVKLIQLCLSSSMHNSKQEGIILRIVKDCYALIFTYTGCSLVIILILHKKYLNRDAVNTSYANASFYRRENVLTIRDMIWKNMSVSLQLHMFDSTANACLHVHVHFCLTMFPSQCLYSYYVIVYFVIRPAWQPFPIALNFQLCAIASTK